MSDKEEAADAIVSRLYRRFKEWSKRGFGPDDVTWCEVKADVLALMDEHTRPQQAVALAGEVEERLRFAARDDVFNARYGANEEVSVKRSDLRAVLSALRPQTGGSESKVLSPLETTPSPGIGHDGIDRSAPEGR